MDSMSYENGTKNAYRNKIKAKSYQDQYIKGAKWARFTMWWQKKILKRVLNECNFTKSDIILDIPCGAGYIGDLLSNIPSKIVASDISLEMMDLARNEYEANKFLSFVQSDIIENTFKNGHFACVIVLALMHRSPADIREKVCNVISKLTNRYVIISYSVESSFQKLKQSLLQTISSSYIPAPSSIPLQKIHNELSEHGLIWVNKSIEFNINMLYSPSFHYFGIMTIYIFIMYIRNNIYCVFITFFYGFYQSFTKPNNGEIIWNDYCYFHLLLSIKHHNKVMSASNL